MPWKECSVTDERMQLVVPRNDWSDNQHVRESVPFTGAFPIEPYKLSEKLKAYTIGATVYIR